MLLDPERLIDESIAHLTQLSTVFSSEVAGEPVLRTAEQRAVKEAVD